MIAAVYCRVSTDSQERDGTSLDSQEQACLKKAQELGYEVPISLIYRETFSGLTTNRPLLTILMEKAKAREFDAVIVYSPDRLSRVGEEILNLFKELRIHGVKLVCVNNQVEYSLTGKMIAFILGWASELEAAQIKERTMRGKKTLASRGVLPQGTGIGLYGYKWNKATKKRIPDEYEVKVVNKIFTMIADGDSRYKVATILNELGIPTRSKSKWHPLGIERLITNTGYIGKTYFGQTTRENKKLKLLSQDKWHLLPDTTPAIVSEELFNRANKALKRGKEQRCGRPQHDYLMTGYIKCGYCGSPLIGSCLSHKYRYYHCRGAYPTTTRKAYCKAGYIRAEEVEALVWDKVKEVIENPEVILAELKRRQATQTGGNTHKLEKEISAINRRLDDYSKQEKRLIDLLRHDGITQDAILEGMNRIKLERQADQDRMAELAKIKGQEVDIIRAEDQLKTYCGNVKKNLDSCSFKEKRYALDALDVKVIAADKKLEIKVSVPLEFTPVEKVSTCIIKYRKKTRKPKLKVNSQILEATEK